MADKEIKIATEWLKNSAPSAKKTCSGIDLRGLPVLGYEHDGGYIVEGLNEYYESGEMKGFPKKYWLYVVCPKCGYQMSFEHMGIPRSAVIHPNFEG